LMGIEENRHATEIRRKLFNPPNAVPDLGIDLKRPRPPQPRPKPQIESSQPAPPEPPPSNIILFTPLGLTPLRVIDLVAKHTGFTVAGILGKARQHPITFARHIAFWLCIKHFPKRSLPQMGKIFNRDHTSVIHGRERIDTWNRTALKVLE
jgi:hypothetical protein